MQKTIWLLRTTFLAIVLAGGAASAAEPVPADNAPAASQPGVKEVTLKGTLGCGKCSFHEAKACENVLKVKDGDKEESYLLADNAVSRANHEKVCGPASPATVTGTVSEKKTKKKSPRKVLTASAITFE
jgi:Family of unknown function (DUF6370)